MKKSESKIRIIYQGEYSKLTARGKGTLSYELGIESNEQFIRIAGNSQGGTYSVEWISLKSLETLLTSAFGSNETNPIVAPVDLIKAQPTYVARAKAVNRQKQNDRMVSY